jgi:hypothetical protein
MLSKVCPVNRYQIAKGEKPPIDDSFLRQSLNYSTLGPEETIVFSLHKDLAVGYSERINDINTQIMRRAVDIVIDKLKNGYVYNGLYYEEIDMMCNVRIIFRKILENTMSLHHLGARELVLANMHRVN